MSATNTFQYPNINLPPIVYQNELKGEKLGFAPTTSADASTPYLLGHSVSAPAHARQTPLSFVPGETNGVLIPMEGDVSHPNKHVLTASEFVSPTKTQVVVAPPLAAPEAPLSQEDFHEMEPAKKGYTPITRVDEEAMKFYVAGIGVVSLLILYKIMY